MHSTRGTTCTSRRNGAGTDSSWATTRRSLPAYSAIAAGYGNFSFMLRMPVEINLRDGLGSLPNQNAAASFKVRMQLNASTAVYGRGPRNDAAHRPCRVTQYAWDQPNPADGQAANQTAPPAVNTTQFWSTQVYNVNAGAQTVRLTRVGNYLRNVIFILRRAGTSRANGQADFPDPFTLLIDARPQVHRGAEQLRDDHGGAVRVRNVCRNRGPGERLPQRSRQRRFRVGLHARIRRVDRHGEP
jgi:hypothetical protein